MRVAPGGPFDLERPLEAKVMENLNRIYKLDRPLWEQYWLYLSSLLQGDFGPSFYYRDFSVGELLARGLPVSITLGALRPHRSHSSLGITLGVVAALRQQPAGRLHRDGPCHLRHHGADLRHRADVADRLRRCRSPGCRSPAGTAARRAT